MKMNNKYIKFKGELSKNCKKILSNNIFKVSLIAPLIPIFIMSIFVILLAIYLNVYYLLLLILPLILYIGCLLTPYLTLESTREVIIQDNIIYIKYGKYEASRDINDVKIILDYDNGYYFKFYFPYKFIYCFCQKDLLVEGSIEEFEKLFGDKIVKVKR